jgi:hypothetical protein
MLLFFWQKTTKHQKPAAGHHLNRFPAKSASHNRQSTFASSSAIAMEDRKTTEGRRSRAGNPDVRNAQY